MYLYQKYKLELKTHIFILWVNRLPTRTKSSNETFSFFLTVRICFLLFFHRIANKKYINLCILKGVLCSFGEYIVLRRETPSFIIFFMPK